MHLRHRLVWVIAHSTAPPQLTTQNTCVNTLNTCSADKSANNSCELAPAEMHDASIVDDTMVATVLLQQMMVCQRNVKREWRVPLRNYLSDCPWKWDFPLLFVLLKAHCSTHSCFRLPRSSTPTAGGFVKPNNCGSFAYIWLVVTAAVYTEKKWIMFGHH